MLDLTWLFAWLSPSRDGCRASPTAVFRNQPLCKFGRIEQNSFSTKAPLSTGNIETDEKRVLVCTKNLNPDIVVMKPVKNRA